IPIAFAAAAAMVVAAYYGTQFQIVLVGVAVFPLMFGFALVRGSRRGVTHSMAITLFGIAWIAVPFAHAVLLRQLPVHGGALVIDRFESMVKRDLEIKDTGRAFGPHGGLLDRLDAVLFTIVVGYYLAVALVY